MERNYTIDFIRFFAIFFVVSIHTGPFAGHTPIFESINIFARFAVPFFFIVSGYFFGKRLQEVKKPAIYLKNSLLKNAKLYISWIAIFFFYDFCIVVLSAISKGENVKPAVIEYFNNFFSFRILFYGTETGSHHLWFLIALLWSTLIVYAFVRIKKLGVLLGISLTLNMVGLLGQSYNFIIEIPFYTRDALFFGLLYTTLGCFFAFHQNRIKWGFKVWLSLVAIFSVLQVVEGLALINLFESQLGSYYLLTLPLCISLFACSLTYNGFSKDNILVKIGIGSVGIYVMHPIFITATLILVNLLNLEYITHTLAWNIVFTPAILFVSYLSYEFIQKMKRTIINGEKVESKKVF